MRLFPKAWTMPGGGLELGETIAQSALRELEEECGIKVEPDSSSNTYVTNGKSVTVEPFFLYESNSAIDNT
jgi:8-oxo-dGTP pyrophosphatase MutT (NUDIX family)